MIIVVYWKDTLSSYLFRVYFYLLYVLGLDPIASHEFLDGTSYSIQLYLIQFLFACK